MLFVCKLVYCLWSFECVPSHCFIFALSSFLFISIWKLNYLPHVREYYSGGSSFYLPFQGFRNRIELFGFLFQFLKICSGAWAFCLSLGSITISFPIGSFICYNFSASWQLIFWTSDRILYLIFHYCSGMMTASSYWGFKGNGYIEFEQINYAMGKRILFLSFIFYQISWFW